MPTIAKGEITISTVNDAFTVSVTPSLCVIRAAFDGNSPILDNTEATISILLGNKKIPFGIVAPHVSTNGVTFTYSLSSDNTVLTVKITNIPNTIADGWVSFEIQTLDNLKQVLNVQFPFTVVRESSMLDWIQDWEGSKTKIGGTYIMTPNLFVGKKEAVVSKIGGEISWSKGNVTGVYIGPSLFDASNNSVGIYGYLKDKEIFHIDSDGGFLGGWLFDTNGLKSNNGVVKILSEGSICAQDPTSAILYWSLMADGSATFANGNVKFDSSGNAEFTGEITSSKGTIAGWKLSKNQIQKDSILIDSYNKIIGIFANETYSVDEATGDIQFPESPNGGVKIWHTSSSDFGFAGWDTSSNKVFQLGSDNFIAGWRFSHQALWTGSESPTITSGAFANENSLTISPTGIRSNNWYIESQGSACFVGGLVKFNLDNGELFGWLLRDGRMSSKHAAVISSDNDCGIYVSTIDISETSAGSLKGIVSNKGGIYMCSNSSHSEMCAYDKNGNLGFRLTTNGSHQIGNWSFNNESIYTGDTELNENGFAKNKDSLLLSTNGLIGCLWKLMADGSGAVAGGNICWDTQGNLTFTSNVKLAWSSITNGPNLTKIDANGIYTGTISANSITAGTISTASIKSEGKWALNIDGSGSLASGNITWTKEGVLSVQKAIFDNVRINGTVRQPWSRSGVYITIGGESLTYDNIAAGATGGWGDGSIASMLTWTLQDSGRIVRIANWKWGSETFDGDLTITAPSGKYFYEDGLAKSKLVLSREIVELIGYADDSTFYGWAVVNRVNFNTRARYGRRLNCLAMGIVIDNGSATPNVQCTTFDGSSITVSRTATGVYEMALPSAWQLEADGYQVMVTGYGSGYMKGTLASRTSTKCVIHVSDDSSPNNGSFQFQIFNTNDWIG